MMDSDGYYELPVMPPCPECDAPLNEYGECGYCLEAAYYAEMDDAA